jgi:hypothetical protein
MAKGVADFQLMWGSVPSYVVSKVTLFDPQKPGKGSGGNHGLFADYAVRFEINRNSTKVSICSCLE